MINWILKCHATYIFYWVLTTAIVFSLARSRYNRSMCGKTILGWVLCGSMQAGPCAETVAHVSVSTVLSSPVERLWELEEPPVCDENGPSFPLSKSEDHYEVGLLWRSSERPADNRQQAQATLQSLLAKFERRQEYIGDAQRIVNAINLCS